MDWQSLEIQGISVMYRERDQSSVGGVLGGDDRWQDWPAETSSTRFEGKPGPASPQLPNRKTVSYYLKPGTATELPVPLRHSAMGAANGAKPRGRVAKTIALVLAALLALGVAGWYGQYWWTTGRYLVSTDDAYVGAKNATLAAKISGYVADVLVDDNAHVREGDVIARIDDGDYQLRSEARRVGE